MTVAVTLNRSDGDVAQMGTGDRAQYRRTMVALVTGLSANTNFQAAAIKEAIKALPGPASPTYTGSWPLHPDLVDDNLPLLYARAQRYGSTSALVTLNFGRSHETPSELAAWTMAYKSIESRQELVYSIQSWGYYWSATHGSPFIGTTIGPPYDVVIDAAGAYDFYYGVNFNSRRLAVAITRIQVATILDADPESTYSSVVGTTNNASFTGDQAYAAHRLLFEGAVKRTLAGWQKDGTKITRYNLVYNFMDRPALWDVITPKYNLFRFRANAKPSDATVEPYILANALGGTDYIAPEADWTNKFPLHTVGMP